MIMAYLHSYLMDVGFEGLIGLYLLDGGESLLELYISDITIVISGYCC